LFSGFQRRRSGSVVAVAELVVGIRKMKALVVVVA